MLDERSLIAASYVPQVAAQKFSSLHFSLKMSKETFQKGGFLTFAERKPHDEVIGIYNRQIEAIEKLLTASRFEGFWKSCSEEKAEEFYNVWHQAFSDWALKPSISVKEKKEKIEQAQGHIEKVVEIMKIDTSLQREIGIAIRDAVNGIWRETKKSEEDWEAIEILDSQNFLKSLSDRLGMCFDEYSWQSTHNKYPKQIKQGHVERDHLIKYFAPFFYSVHARKEHIKFADFLGNLFPGLEFGRDPSGTVRKALAE